MLDLRQTVQQLFIQVAQRRAHTLFNSGMVKRHLKHLFHRHAALARPCEQVREVFCAWSNHFRANEAA
jgi:hypothetical protein